MLSQYKLKSLCIDDVSNRLALATLESTQEGGIDDMALVDATSLRRQVFIGQGEI